MGINGQLTAIIFWTALLCCHSNPTKKHKLSNKLDHKEAVNFLFRFTRDAVPTKPVEKNSAIVAVANNSLLPSWLSSGKKQPATEPPLKRHVAVVENKGPPTSDIIQPIKDNADKTSDKVKEQGPKFDDKAIQRAFTVFGGLCAIMLIYFGLKYMFRRRRKTDGRYGRVDSSEMDLLESTDDIEEEEEDDTLFDIQAHTRT